ncbi:MAG: DUF3180 domain-containing protein [Actinomycetaceae bacterium]|nr:DUF3180 domain-containing protein [Actinomycetaceae bacterium]
MKTLSIRTLALVAACSGVLAAIATYAVKLRAGTYPQITPLMGVLFLSISLLLWVWGRKIVAYKEKRTHLDLTSAVNVAYLAYSAAWTGAIFTGALSGLIIPMLTTLESVYVQQAVWKAGLSALAALTMTVVAVIVERWCRRDEDDETPQREGLEPEAS